MVVRGIQLDWFAFCVLREYIFFFIPLLQMVKSFITSEKHKNIFRIVSAVLIVVPSAASSANSVFPSVHGQQLAVF